MTADPEGVARLRQQLRAIGIRIQSLRNQWSTAADRTKSLVEKVRRLQEQHQQLEAKAERSQGEIDRLLASQLTTHVNSRLMGPTGRRPMGTTFS